MNKVYLNIGSNIEPEKNVLQAIKLLKKKGKIESISSVWESESVGYAGANFLNLCVLFLTDLQPNELKEKVIRPIENELGRVRDNNKNSPRTIDIDTVLFNKTPYHINTWKYAFVVVPLAELIPDFVHPFEDKPLVEVANQIQTWIMKREDFVIS